MYLLIANKEIRRIATHSIASTLGWGIIGIIPCFLLASSKIFVVGAIAAAIFGILISISIRREFVYLFVALFIAWSAVQAYPRLRVVSCYFLRDDVGRPGCERVNLPGANLQGLPLTSSGFLGFNMREANLPNAKFGGAFLGGVDLYGADLSGANLDKAVLYHVDFTKADLSGATLRSITTAVGVNFAEANLCGANLKGTDLTLVGLRDAYFNNDTQWPEDIDPLAKGAIFTEDECQQYYQ
ncbi:MAG: pentapeptide repeat-containing protein [Chloroflexota bacterium]